MDTDEREKTYKKEHLKLKKLIKAVVDDEDFKKVEGLVENAAFMRASLLELQDEIRTHGYVESYQNGENQFGMKDSVYVRTYNSMVKNYTSLMKTLTGMLPMEAKAAEDTFGAFLGGGKA